MRGRPRRVPWYHSGLLGSCHHNLAKLLCKDVLGENNEGAIITLEYYRRNERSD